MRATQGIRCDSAQAVEPTRFDNPACIFTAASPSLNLNINDGNIDESAGHIRFAQQNPSLTKPSPPGGVSKSIPSVLRRHWDPELNADQREVSVAACHDAYGDTQGKDCDEFPFASTLEGSLGTPGPGQGDTNYNFSVRYIAPGDNRRVGCWLKLWYKKDRILERDSFQVNIFDGPVVNNEDPEPAPGECDL